MHFDHGLDIVVAADASDYGVGAIISQKLWPLFQVKKFHRYIYGIRFLLLTDQKPLLSIFRSNVGISQQTQQIGSIDGNLS